MIVMMMMMMMMMIVMLINVQHVWNVCYALAELVFRVASRLIHRWCNRIIKTDKPKSRFVTHFMTVACFVYKSIFRANFLYILNYWIDARYSWGCGYWRAYEFRFAAIASFAVCRLLRVPCIIPLGKKRIDSWNVPITRGKLHYCHRDFLGDISVSHFARGKCSLETTAAARCDDDSCQDIGRGSYCVGKCAHLDRDVLSERETSAWHLSRGFLRI